MSLTLASEQADPTSKEQPDPTSNRNVKRKVTISDHYLPILSAITGKEPARFQAAVGHWLNEFKKACFITDTDLGGRFLKPNPAFEKDPNYSILNDLCGKLNENSGGSLIDGLYGDLHYGQKNFPYGDGKLKFDDDGRLRDEFRIKGCESLWIENFDILEMIEKHFNILKPLNNVIVPFVPKPFEGTTPRKPCPFFAK